MTDEIVTNTWNVHGSRSERKANARDLCLAGTADERVQRWMIRASKALHKENGNAKASVSSHRRPRPGRLSRVRADRETRCGCQAGTVQRRFSSRWPIKGARPTRFPQVGLCGRSTNTQCSQQWESELS